MEANSFIFDLVADVVDCFFVREELALRPLEEFVRIPPASLYFL